MEQIMNYVKPELLVLAIVLYLVGNALKKLEMVKDKYIPIILGGMGIILSGIWVVSTSSLNSLQEISMAVFTAFVQGILVAGLSTYIDQLGKQLNKKE